MAREKKTESKAEPKGKAKAEAKPKPKPKVVAKAASKPKAEAKPKAGTKSKPEATQAKHEHPFAEKRPRGKQFRVAQDEEHILPHLSQAPGSKVKIERVLLISDGNGVEVGKPLIEGAVVTLEVVGHEKGEKITVGTYKRRKKYRRKIGYRDTLTRVKILGIEMPAREKREKHGA
jgi:large subunit ribosomal protein L21